MTILFVAWALLGHFSFCVAVVNRVHSTAVPRLGLKAFDLLWYVWVLGIPWAIATRRLSPSFANFYVALCVISAGVVVAHRLSRLLQSSTTPHLVSNHTRLHLPVDAPRRFASSPLTKAFSFFPGNEILSLSVHEKTLVLPRLDPDLIGFTITHVSDLHLTGQLSQAFYEEVVRQTNALQGDLMAITGDIVEKRRCLPWVGDTLGHLRAELGVFYVLGNHELRIRDETLVRTTLDQAGFIGLGGRWVTIGHANAPLVLAGNELPWFPPAADMQTCRASIMGKRPLRICLSHSPDQLAWAQTNDFDLLLAGHTHGGQVRFPLIGPILSPSAFGTRHASGTFFHVPTLMHVSRGIAGTRPLRLNCPPEITRLTLKPA